MTLIPESHKDLLERPILAALATVQPDGAPQVTPVWIALRDGKILINTAAGRQKHKNLIERPRATVLLIDPDNGQRYLEVRGTVVDSFDHADADIDALAKKYLGVDSYPYRVATDTRVTFLIEPTRVTGT